MSRLAARVLGEFGDGPNRYAEAGGRQNYAGMAPITRRLRHKAGALEDAVEATKQMPEITLGVDTHLDAHVAVALDERGRVVGRLPIATTPAGYRQLLSWAISQ